MKVNKLKSLSASVFCLVISLWSDIRCIEEDKLDEQTGKYISMQQRPEGPEEWKDQFGNYAPLSVRMAADKLWDNIEIEGKAAFGKIHACESL